MGSEIDILKFSADEIDAGKIKDLISKKRSFQIVAVKDISFVVNKIEGEIEKQDLSCRVFSEFRAAAIAGIVVPTGVTQLVGAATAIGVGIHNLVTINPDYEIGKNKLAGTVTVNYTRE